MTISSRQPATNAPALPTAAVAVAEEPNLDPVHPETVRASTCVSAECVDRAENVPGDDYAYHFDTRDDMDVAIDQTDWHLGRGGLPCTLCAFHGSDTAASQAGANDRETLDWLPEACCFTIHCTRCHIVFESDCGEAHFPSIRAAAEAALSAHWTVSTHRVWCRSCTALVSGGESATSTPPGTKGKFGHRLVDAVPAAVGRHNPARVITEETLR